MRWSDQESQGGRSSTRGLHTGQDGLRTRGSHRAASDADTRRYPLRAVLVIASLGVLLSERNRGGRGCRADACPAGRGGITQLCVDCRWPLDADERTPSRRTARARRSRTARCAGRARPIRMAPEAVPLHGRPGEPPLDAPRYPQASCQVVDGRICRCQSRRRSKLCVFDLDISGRSVPQAFSSLLTRKL
jgi:hypothetical protein